MTLTRLSGRCQQCPFQDTCNHKQMEALGHLPLPIVAPSIEVSTAALSQPLMRETLTIGFKDEIEKELTKHLYKGLGLRYGG